MHFFKNPATLLTNAGHTLLFTSREKDVTTPLLDQLGLPHKVLSSSSGKGLVSLAGELLSRNTALYREVKRFKPDIMASIGGTFIAHVGALTRTPSLVFYDTENATLQNAITYPLASCVLVPKCYESWLPRKKHIRYAGYHELSYLHPARFTPDRKRAIANGLALQGDTFLLRLVSWQANHDIGESGWNHSLLSQLVDWLSQRGKVLISSEDRLSEDLEPFRFTGAESEIHHLMAFCKAFIGESATMASECAVLGVPAIYAAHTGRGYTNEQQQRFELVYNLKELELTKITAVIDDILNVAVDTWAQRRQCLLDENIDVAQFVVDCIINHPQPLIQYNRGNA